MTSGTEEAEGDAVGRRHAHALVVATDPDTSRRRLWLLAKRWGGDKDIARAIARHPNAGGAVLHAVVNRSLAAGRWQVAVAAVESPFCSPRLYETLALSPFHAVQAAVASSRRTPLHLLQRLAAHPGAWMRLHVATNPALRGPEVEVLMTDADPYVRCVAAGHPNASADGLRRLCAGYREPAWTLRAAAANPACPPDLSDQTLTWLALGGAGNSDPTFDPVTCTGNPGPANVHAFTWYMQTARDGLSEVHPLSRVRAAFPSSRPRVLISTLIWLARDPSPEVRRVAARFHALPLSDLKALAVDDDPIVARTASTTIKGRKQALKGQTRVSGRRRRVLALRFLPLIAGALLFAQTQGHQTGSLYPYENGMTVQTPNAFELPLSSMPGLDGSTGRHTYATSAVQGGGEIDSGTMLGDGVPFVTITAGQVALTVSIPGAVAVSGSAVTSVPDPLTVSPGGAETVALPDAKSAMTISVRGSDGTVLYVSLRFG